MTARRGQAFSSKLRPKTPKPNNNHNDNNNSFGKNCLGQSLPMQAPRGQAFSSKLRTPKPQAQQQQRQQQVASVIFFNQLFKMTIKQLTIPGFGLGPKLVEGTSPRASLSSKLRSEAEPKMMISIAIFSILLSK